MMSETIIDRPVIDIDYDYGKCVGCGREATRTNNTLCVQCWHDAEGENE